MKAFASNKVKTTMTMNDHEQNSTEVQNSELAKQSLQMDRPLTPPDIKRFRSQGDPGAKITHYGKANDNLPPPEFTFGAPSPKAAYTAADALNPKIDPLKEEELINKEKIYKKPPLGKATTRYELPENVAHNDEAFGMKTLSLKDGSVSDCLSYEEEGESPSKRIRERPSTVPGITFGKANERNGDSVLEAINWKTVDGVSQPKRIRGYETRW